jgi:hypothetical protein
MAGKSVSRSDATRVAAVRRARAVRIILAICLLTAFASAVSGQYDPFVGTWELNLRKSSFRPGAPPKKQTLICRDAERGLRTVLHGVDAHGMPVEPDANEMHITFDGKDHRTPQRDYDWSAWVRISARKYEVIHKRAGQVVLTSTYMLSNDGKTMIVIARGVDGDGRVINNVRVYDKKE